MKRIISPTYIYIWIDVSQYNPKKKKNRVMTRRYITYKRRTQIQNQGCMDKVRYYGSR